MTNFKTGDKVRYTGLSYHPKDTIYTVDYVEDDGYISATQYVHRDKYLTEYGTADEFELVYDYDVRIFEVDRGVLLSLTYDKNTGLYVADPVAYEEWRES